MYIFILFVVFPQDTLSQNYVVQVLESFHFRNHYCIVFELLSINLYDFIKANHFKGFSLSLVRKYAQREEKRKRRGREEEECMFTIFF